MKAHAFLRGDTCSYERGKIHDEIKKNLFQNHLANFNQTWHKASLVEEDFFFLTNKGPFQFSKRRLGFYSLNKLMV